VLLSVPSALRNRPHSLRPSHLGGESAEQSKDPTKSERASRSTIESLKLFVGESPRSWLDKPNSAAQRREVIECHEVATAEELIMHVESVTPTWTIIIVRPSALSRAMTKTISKHLESNTTAGVKSIRRKRLTIQEVDLRQQIRASPGRAMNAV